MLLKDGSAYTPEDQDISNWRNAYPDLNIDTELSRMAAWCDANPGKRKTRTGIRRFIVSWLNRANQTGGSPEDIGTDTSTVPDEIRRDDVIHKLRQTFEFFGKTLTREAALVFLRGLHKFDADVVVMALDEYMMRGRYCPKPVDIIGICDEVRARSQFAKPREQQQQGNPAPPHIAKAWMWYIKNYVSVGLTEGLFSRAGDKDCPEAKEYVRTMTQQALHFNRPNILMDLHGTTDVERLYPDI